MSSDPTSWIPPEAIQLQPGTQIIGTYEIEQHLNTGGMGEVYRGRNIHTDEPVAIKVVLPALAHDPKILSLFQKEATVLNRLSHDAIVRYQIFTVDPGIQRPCLVMEFVDGESLADYMRRGRMPVGDVMVLLARVASGLGAAHKLGVIHRDLSPDNVILHDGSVAHAKIIDFGIAKAATIGKSGTLIGGDFAGKFGFVAPEQLGKYGRAVTERSDIYSLGLLSVAACRGEALDMGDDYFMALEKRNEVPDLSGIEEPLAGVLAYMLQPDPADRPESMEAVVALLAPDLGTVPGIAMPGQSLPPQSLPPRSMPPQSAPPQSAPPQSAPPEPAPRSVAPPPAAPVSAPPPSSAAAEAPTSTPPEVAPQPSQRPVPQPTAISTPAAPAQSAPPQSVPPQSVPPQSVPPRDPTMLFTPEASLPPRAAPSAPPRAAPAATVIAPLSVPPGGGEGAVPRLAEGLDNDSPFGPEPAVPAAASLPPVAAPVPPAKGGGMGKTVGIAVVALAVVGGAGAYFGGLFGPTRQEAPVQTVAEAPAPEKPAPAAKSEPAPAAKPAQTAASSAQKAPGAASAPPATPPASKPEPAPKQMASAEQAPAAPRAVTEGDSALKLAAAPPEGAPAPAALAAPRAVPSAPATDNAPTAATRPAPPPVDVVARRRAWIAAYDPGACSFVAPVSVTAGAVGLRLVSDEPGRAAALKTAFAGAEGVTPAVATGTAPVAAQCPALDLARGLKAGGAPPLTVSLGAATLKAGQDLRGSLGGIGGRAAMLLMIDGKGRAYDLTRKLDPKTGAFGFTLFAQDGAEAASGSVPLLLLAVTSATPLAIGPVPAGTPVATLAPILKAELAQPGRAAQATAITLDYKY